MSISISKQACAGLFASAKGQKDEIENIFRKSFFSPETDNGSSTCCIACDISHIWNCCLSMVFYVPNAICVQQSDTFTVLTAALTVFTLFVNMCVLAVLNKVLRNLLTTDKTEVIKAFRAFSSSFFFYSTSEVH